eukprot:TRINITY_DN11914_c0_g1_i9.p1 TRINITY_DN11914_c0_g1~~TRINITY_DN11914_c0_g1_i9.p1  ORF type:complete len:280 (-),score=69.48 TRINITY_DN11914_c0_g1_i9:152-991(-)
MESPHGDLEDPEPEDGGTESYIKKVYAIVIVCAISSVLFSIIVQFAVLAGRPSSQVEQVSFQVIGDWGRRGLYHTPEVAQAMTEVAKTHETQFVCTAGDNFYQDGISNASDPSIAVSWTDVFTQPEILKKWYPTLGNHDYYGNVSAELNIPGDVWEMPDRYYAKELVLGDSSVLLLFLDTPSMVFKYGIMALNDPKIKHNLDTAHSTFEQLSWIDDTLEESSACIKILVGHHPMYKEYLNSTTAMNIRKLLQPIIDKHHVTAYIAGHEHNLQYLSLIHI